MFVLDTGFTTIYPITQGSAFWTRYPVPAERKKELMTCQIFPGGLRDGQPKSCSTVGQSWTKSHSVTRYGRLGLCRRRLILWGLWKSEALFKNESTRYLSTLQLLFYQSAQIHMAKNKTEKINSGYRETQLLSAAVTPSCRWNQSFVSVKLQGRITNNASQGDVWRYYTADNKISQQRALVCAAPSL